MRPLHWIVALLVTATLVAACGGSESRTTDTAAKKSGAALPFTISAEDFARGDTIPVKLTCDGADRSPRLFWTAVPENAKELALIVDDPDAGGFVHWVAYNTPITGREFAADQNQGELVTFGANDFGGTGWAGPCPPPGDPHQYDFTLYAVSEPLDLEPGATADELRRAMDGKILDEAGISAFYKRREG